MRYTFPRAVSSSYYSWQQPNYQSVGSDQIYTDSARTRHTCMLMEYIITSEFRELWSESPTHSSLNPLSSNFRSFLSFASPSRQT